MDTDELMDLVDKNDIKIGVINRLQLDSLMDINKKCYLRTSCALMRNSLGQYWTPRRVATKKIAPNGLDFAMAEHIHVNETYLDAAVRGFTEELNLHIRPTDLTLVGILGPRVELQLPYFSAIYTYDTDSEPDEYNRDDFVGGEWLEPQEIIAQVKNGQAAKSLLVPAVKLALLQQGRL
ncbi:MAG TPA: NUDIX domain-containing protein [Candidatus Saccharimonadia bacterium]|nr:NUDIX domain-containing protein [Candidatus Saccharimonadia bacterium]